MAFGPYAKNMGKWGIPGTALQRRKQEKLAQATTYTLSRSRDADRLKICKCDSCTNQLPGVGSRDNSASKKCFDKVTVLQIFDHLCQYIYSLLDINFFSYGAIFKNARLR